jgi:hypothetical protein
MLNMLENMNLVELNFVGKKVFFYNFCIITIIALLSF